MEWLGGILLIAALFGGFYAWETIKEKAVAKGGAAGKAMQGVETAGEVIGGGIHTILQKGGGLLVGALGVLLCSVLIDKGFSFGILLGVAVCFAYALYLLRPGRRSFFIFF